jgi:hypothetical protein
VIVGSPPTSAEWFARRVASAKIRRSFGDASVTAGRLCPEGVLSRRAWSITEPNPTKSCALRGQRRLIEPMSIDEAYLISRM